MIIQGYLKVLSGLTAPVFIGLGTNIYIGIASLFVIFNDYNNI